MKASVAIASGSDPQFPKDESWVVRLEAKRSTSSGSSLWLITFGQSIQSDMSLIILDSILQYSSELRLGAGFVLLCPPP